MATFRVTFQYETRQIHIDHATILVEADDERAARAVIHMSEDDVWNDPTLTTQSFGSYDESECVLLSVEELTTS